MKKVQRLLSIKFNKYPESHCLNQIYNSGWECAMAARKTGESIYSQSMPFVHCKDYIHEVVWGTLYSKTADVYGMTYDPEKFPLDMKRLRLLIRDNSITPAVLRKNCIRSRGLLRDFDTLFGFTRTVLKKATEESNPTYSCFIFEADKKWMTAAPLLSLYALLCRAGKFWTPEYKGKPKEFLKFFIGPGGPTMVSDSDENDRYYLNTFVSKGGLEKLADNPLALFHKHPKDNYCIVPGWDKGQVDAYALHNYGIVSYSNSGFPKYEK